MIVNYEVIIHKIKDINKESHKRTTKKWFIIFKCLRSTRIRQINIIVSFIRRIFFVFPTKYRQQSNAISVPFPKIAYAKTILFIRSFRRKITTLILVHSSSLFTFYVCVSIIVCVCVFVCVYVCNLALVLASQS